MSKQLWLTENDGLSVKNVAQGMFRMKFLVLYWLKTSKHFVCYVFFGDGFVYVMQPFILYLNPDGQTLPINRRQKAYNNGTLVIEQLQRAEDAGTYTCMAQNKLKQTSRRNVEIQVLSKLKKKTKNQTVILNGNFEFSMESFYY